MVPRAPARTSRRSPARRGFTLIEAIASMVILGIALPPMLWAVRQEHRNRISPLYASKARWLATEKLEDIIADRHSTTRGYAYLTAGNYPAEATISGYPGFSRSVALVETGPDLATAGTGYMKVTVSVTWTDSTGTSRTLPVSTVLTDYN
ncbi:MAG: prepilin-type N-terminal cleavage/methylation domain-containing protein [Phycisphaeraceae bacterium]|nr:prepilin-type N-terminal cleavage/methylation domain-containing protein [Phycisphaeraceae bacterium]